MQSIAKVLAAVMLAAGIGFAAIAVTPSRAVAAGCRTENTDYTGPGTTQNCLGGTCREGWCCLICETVIEP